MDKKEERKKSEKDLFRSRIEKEDALLNSRTTIFLTVNGLWAAVVSIGTDLGGRVLLAFFGTVISIFWIITIWKTWNVIDKLTKEYLKIKPANRVEEIAQAALGSPRWWRPRPSTILGVYMPWISFLAWLVGLSLLLRTWLKAKAII